MQLSNGGRLLALALALALVVGQSAGFVLVTKNRDAIPSQVSEETDQTHRWNWASGSLVDNGVRGLGGGLEYSFEDGFCANMMPMFFLEFPAVPCSLVKDTIRSCLDAWAESHEKISFYDVTSDVAAKENSGTGGAVGAEINFLVRDHWETLTDVSEPDTNPATTTHYTVAASDIITPNGQSRTGYRIEAADVIFNPKSCMYLDNSFCSFMHPQDEVLQILTDIFFFGVLPFFVLLQAFCLCTMCLRGFHRFPLQSGCYIVNIVLVPMIIFLVYLPCKKCSSFETVVIHEIGHVLGLDHPNTYKERNLDTDNDPYNEMRIECVGDPATGLILSSVVDGDSVMSIPNWSRCLRVDDRFGLQYLYPYCTSTYAAECSSANQWYYILLPICRILLVLPIGLCPAVLFACCFQFFCRKYHKNHRRKMDERAALRGPNTMTSSLNPQDNSIN